MMGIIAILLILLLIILTFFVVCLAVASGRNKDRFAEDEAQMKAISEHKKRK